MSARTIFDYTIYTAWMGLILMLPLSKGGSSVGVVSLGLLSIPLLILEKENLFNLIKSHLPVSLLALPWFAYVASLLYSSDIQAGMAFVNRELFLLLLPLIVIIHRKFLKKHLHLFLGVFIVAVTFNALVTTVLYLLPESASKAFSEFPLCDFIGVKEYQELSKREAFGIYSPFMVRVQFSNLIAIAFLSLLWLYTNAFRRWLLIPMGLILLICTGILGGRGGQLGLLIALGIWVLGWYFLKIHQKVKSKTSTTGSFGLVSIILMLGFIVAPYIAYKKVPAISERYNQLIWEMKLYRSGEYLQYEYVHFTSLRRIISYQNMWELVRANPILGTGVGDYQKEIDAIYQINNPEFPVNSHSYLLFLWSSAGVLAVFAYLLGLGIWLVNLFRNGRRWDLIFGLSLFVFYLAIWMLEAMINQVDLTLFGFIMGALYLIISREPPSKIEE